MTDERISERTGRHGPTIRDVARIAGVSIGTASKALNANGRLRQETRDKVMAVAREIGYRPNDMAQSLHRTRSMTVGVLSTDSFGRFTLPIFKALEEEFADQGIAIFMCNATDDPERERQHLDQLLGKRIDGLVVTARRSDKRSPVGPLPPGLPVIYVFSQADDEESLSLVPDDESGARLAVRHLAEVGCTRIACVTGPEHFESVTLRRRGYSQSLREAGLPEHPEYYLPGPWSEAWGREAVGLLFDGKAERPDGLFCGNDQIARGAAEALRERAIDVPGQVAIVGFDNWNVMTDAARPPLSSVDMNLAALGHEAGRLLMDMIGGETIRGLRRLPCTLVVRDSSSR
ncbi:MAG TPA: LacI family DNA-binding transcriptional regulator [Devosia sp.]|jgi:LacI family transcriptional regulator|uniref:LacI family DNA-binding transcriptional regulator n=1 Tax=Devosia sp. TaxID=1871048 RepID=UPI002DDD86EA|nr:LacI family DNA-binding transcriptional regulator [Devosia sp.]HEV2517887.1 LacI family DNA-binding transcriptional regulator [Devosia sp.]